MERLTERSLDYCTQHCPSEKMISCAFYKDDQAERCLIANMYDRLAAYEDLEEQGRLVVLPCKAGDTVWFNTYEKNATVCVGIQPHEIKRVNVYFLTDGADIPQWGIGKTVFLTRAEAEAAMKGVSEDA